MDNSKTIDQILDKARSHTASRDEYDYVYNVLSKTRDDGLIRKCILALRRESSDEREGVVSRFLNSEDPIIKGEALRFLVRDIGKSKGYIKYIIDFIEGNGDDDDDNGSGSLRLTALQVAGEAYNQTHDINILHHIVNSLDSSREAFRLSAKTSLVAALTPNYQKMLPGERYRLEREADISRYIADAESILKQGGS